MLDSLLLAYAVCRKEVLITYPCSIRLESIKLRNVSLEEDLKGTYINEPCRVLYDLRKESVILLISSELSLTVSVSSNNDRIQTNAILENEHIRIESELPLAVTH